MIKYGTHSYVLTDHWADDQVYLLHQAAELSAQVFEISVGDDVQFDAGLTRREAERVGISLTIGPGGEWPLACDISSDIAEERVLGLAWHQRQIDIAHATGAIAYCGATYGHPGVIKRRLPPPEEYAHVSEGLHELAEYALDKGVRLVLEPMSHFRTHLVNKPEQLMTLIDLADHDNLFVALDTYHLITEIRDYAQAIHCAAPRLWGIHACENDRGVPGGGLVPWETIAKALHEIDFEGIMLLETYNSGIGNFAFRRGMFHDLCPDGPAYVRQGLGFLRRLMGN